MGTGAGLGVKRLAQLAIAAWLAHWLAGELAAYAGRHWREHGPAPIDR